MKKAGSRSLIYLLIWVVISSCAEVPLTHRRSLALISNEQLVALSLRQYEEILKTHKVSTDKEKVSMVKRVGQRISRATEAFLRESGFEHRIKDLQWEFTLFDDDKVANAWCLPGGKVGVYTGILKYTRNEAGLAVVIGHEVAHAIAEHGNERLSQGLLLEFGGAVLSAALSQRPAATRQLFDLVYGIGASIGLVLPYSRLHEEEADRIGLVLMARAGYDPREAVGFWERMRADEKTRLPQFLSTHPAPDTRIAYIRSYIPEAMKYYRPNP